MKINNHNYLYIMNNYDNFIQDHEKFFLDDTQKGRFIVAVGSKGQGKSYLMTSFLKHVLSLGYYKNVHFVCPCYNGEASNSYQFLKDQKHVLIYKSYSQSVSKRVDADRKKAPTLFLIDDGTSELINNIDPSFINLITTNRHFKKCTIYIAVHSSKKAMVPVVRNNIDHIFIYKIANVKLLEDIYYEFFSMLFEKFKSFKDFYVETTKEKNSCIHFSIHQDGIDINVKNWMINREKDKIKLKPTANTHKIKKEEQQPKKIAGLQIKFTRYRKVF